MADALVSSDIASDEISKLLSGNQEQVVSALNNSDREGNTGLLLERIEDVYPSYSLNAPIPFWIGASLYLANQRKSTDAELVSLREFTRQLALMPTRVASRNRALAENARDVFRALDSTKKFNIRSEIIRTHFFMYGLYGVRNDGAEAAILTKEEAVKAAITFAGNFSTIVKRVRTG